MGCLDIKAAHILKSSVLFVCRIRLGLLCLNGIGYSSELDVEEIVPALGYYYGVNVTCILVLNELGAGEVVC